MDFPQAIEAQLAGQVVRASDLVRFDFASQTVRVWAGFGTLKTQDGAEWSGLGELGSITGLSQAINGVAPQTTLQLSGVDAGFAMRAKAESSEYYLRPVFIYQQFFDEHWQTLDLPMAVSFARMTTLTYKMDEGPAGGDKVYTVSIASEGFFVNRRRPRYGYYTDTDQQKRSPGDRACERVMGLQQKTIIFPAA